MKTNRLTRRQFTRTLLTAACATGIAPAFLRGQNLNSKLNIAIIGTGGRGGGNLEWARSGANVVLTWPQGVLLQAPAVTGPWTTNSAASSPFTNAASGSQFYRVLIPVVP